MGVMNIELSDIREDIDDWFRHNIVCNINLFFERVQNLVDWIPVVWKDRDDDPDAFLILLRNKLVKASKFFKTDSIVNDRFECAEQMQECINIIDKLLDMEFAEKIMYPYYEKYPLDLNDPLKSINNSSPEQDEMFRSCIIARDKAEQDLRDELFAKLRKYHEFWID